MWDLWRLRSTKTYFENRTYGEGQFNVGARGERELISRGPDMEIKARDGGEDRMTINPTNPIVMVALNV